MQSWFPFIPESASTISGDVDAVYFYVSGVTVFFVTLISLVIIFFVIRYRRRNAFEIPRPIEGSHTLETLWSVIPLVIAMSIFAWGAKVYFAQYRPPQNALEVYVVGKQWMWKFQHPTGQREINELHVPVGRKVKLIMHVRYSGRLVWLVIGSALFWLGIMFALTISDYSSRGWLPIATT